MCEVSHCQHPKRHVLELAKFLCKLGCRWRYCCNDNGLHCTPHYRCNAEYYEIQYKSAMHDYTYERIYFASLPKNFDTGELHPPPPSLSELIETKYRPIISMPGHPLLSQPINKTKNMQTTGAKIRERARARDSCCHIINLEHSSH